MSSQQIADTLSKESLQLKAFETSTSQTATPGRGRQVNQCHNYRAYTSSKYRILFYNRLLDYNITTMKQPGLSNEEIEACRTAFAMFDKDFSGSIDIHELRRTLNAMGQHPSEEELFLMVSQVDDNGSGTIEFPEFMQLILSQKVQQEHEDNESDTIDAFVALGGNPDKSGVVKTAKLSHVIKVRSCWFARAFLCDGVRCRSLHVLALRIQPLTVNSSG